MSLSSPGPADELVCQTRATNNPLTGSSPCQIAASDVIALDMRRLKGNAPSPSLTRKSPSHSFLGSNVPCSCMPLSPTLPLRNTRTSLRVSPQVALAGIALVMAQANVKLQLKALTVSHRSQSPTLDTGRGKPQARRSNLVVQAGRQPENPDKCVGC